MKVPFLNFHTTDLGEALTTNEAELAEKVCLLRNYGQRKKSENEIQGYNNQLDELQAAFLRVKLALAGCMEYLSRQSSETIPPEPSSKVPA